MFRAGILNVGWHFMMPMVKMYYRVYKKCKFGSGVYLSYLTEMEGNNYIGRNSRISKNTLGYGSYISDNSYFYRVKIGRYSCIGPRTAVICGKHPTDSFVSVHPYFFRSNKSSFSYVKDTMFEEYTYADESTKTAVVIGNDVWIGSDAKIMEGVTIGDGAVVAAGTLVLKDVEPYSIVAGVPAKVVRYRFQNEQIDYLLKLKWWDKPQEWIKENAPLFADIDAFMEAKKE